MYEMCVSVDLFAAFTTSIQLRQKKKEETKRKNENENTEIGCVLYI